MNRFSVAMFAVLASSVSLSPQTPAPTASPSQEQSSMPGRTIPDSSLNRNQIQVWTQQRRPPEKRVFKFVPDSSTAPISGESHTIYMVPGPQSTGCPVSMRAEHGSGGGLVMTRQSRSNGPSVLDPVPGQPAPPFQRIHLILGNSTVQSSAGAKVVSARVTVHGTNGKWRNVPAAMGDDSLTITKTLDVRFDRAEDGQVSSDMTLPGFTSVKSINLDTLTFSDGTIWVPEQGSACRVAPDPLMLVSAGR